MVPQFVIAAACSLVSTTGRASPSWLKTSDLQVTHCGGERGMAHERLNGAQVKAGFQQMRGKAVSQRVNAVAAGDTRPAFGFVVDPLRLADMHLALGISAAGEEPGGRPVEFPVEPEFFE